MTENNRAKISEQPDIKRIISTVLSEELNLYVEKIHLTHSDWIMYTANSSISDEIEKTTRQYFEEIHITWERW